MLRIGSPSARGGHGHLLRGRSLRATALMTAAAVPIVFAVTAGLGIISVPSLRQADPDVTGSLSPAPIRIDASLLDPVPMLGKQAAQGWSTAPLAAGLLPKPSPAGAAATVAPRAVPAGRPAPAPQNAAPEPQRTSQLVHPIPLPAPRPADLSPAAGPAVARAARPAQRRLRSAAVAAPQGDDRSWFEKLFDLNAPTAPGVSYAALDTRAVPVAPQPRLSPSPLPPTESEAGVAVYDISAQTVTLPNGERLEAHSGLGDKMDDPRFVHVRMKGATPPGTYDLTEREAPFHGVRALRLHPVGGSAAIFGRAGILAHSYLLGPNGDSNGCVSFKDYDRFLQAYLRGEVRRIVVIPGNGQDRLPATAGRKRERWDARARNA